MKKLALLLISFLFLGQLFAQDTYNLNDRVEALDKGSWYKATVIRARGGQHFKDGKYYIHWDGYAASYDVWIEPSKMRKMGAGKTSTANTTATTNETTSTSTTSSSAATTSAASVGAFKIGDKVTLMDTGFPDGTITGVKGKDYIVDIADPYYTAWGKQGISEKSLRPQWQYKAFTEELKTLQENASKATKGKFGTIKDIAKMVCQDCSPNGNANMEQTTEFVNFAKNDIVQLRALVKKYEPLPDNGNKLFDRNPALVAKVASESDKIIATLTANAFKPRVKSWFEGEAFYDLTHEFNDSKHMLFKGKTFGEFALCSSLAELRPGLVKNLEDAIKKFSLSGVPEDYLIGFDESFAKRKAKLEESLNDVTWFKEGYPHADLTFNALLVKNFTTEGNPSVKITKVVYDQTGFTTTYDDLGNITGQAKEGIVFYQIPGCQYWLFQYFDAYKDYLGASKYSPTKVALKGYGMLHKAF